MREVRSVMHDLFRGYKEVLSGGVWGDRSSTGEGEQLGSVPPIIVKEKGKWEKEI